MSDQSSQSSGTLSSDGRQKDPTIPFLMHNGGINGKTGLATFYLEMPSSEGMSNTKSHAYPPILLEIKDEDQMDCLMMMKQLNHENISSMHFFEKDGVGGIRAYVEPYTGYVSDLFNEPKYFVDKETGLVPSQPFQEIVSKSMSALVYIFENGLYHGNFSWDTTVYHQDKYGKKIIKLSNFEKRKNKSPLECKVGDCHALAHCLEKASLCVQNYYTDVKPETCVLIDDLARRLRAVTTIESLSTMKEQNEDHPFFWDDNRKKTFFAYEIPRVWDKPAFLRSFERSLSAPALPWNTIWASNDLMMEMEIYRDANGIQKYNPQSRKDFIRFICGLYTHEVELKRKGILLAVDAEVLEKYPRILLDLKAATEAG